MKSKKRLLIARVNRSGGGRFNVYDRGGLYEFEAINPNGVVIAAPVMLRPSELDPQDLATIEAGRL